MEREPTQRARDQLEAADDARPTTSLTGAGGEADGDAETRGAAGDATGDVTGIDDVVIGQPGSGGMAAGVVGTAPDADVPDPLGEDDRPRDLERRTR
jgi:hypothetical protein